MWDYYRQALNHLSHLSRDQWAIVLLVVMVLGWLCMRGFGSRDDY